MKKIILLFCLLYAWLASAQWYYGSGEAVNLENKIGFDKQGQKIISGDSDSPTSTAKSGSAGSLYLRTNGDLYCKQDSGSSTNWSKLAKSSEIITSHNSLSGIQGGAANDYNHVTAAQISDWDYKQNYMTASAPMYINDDNLTISYADSDTDGVVSADDYALFAGKQDALGYEPMRIDQSGFPQTTVGTFTFPNVVSDEIHVNNSIVGGLTLFGDEHTGGDPLGKVRIVSQSGSYGQLQVINPISGEATIVLGSGTANADGTVSSLAEDGSDVWAFGPGSYSNATSNFGIGNVALGYSALNVNGYTGNVVIGNPATDNGADKLQVLGPIVAQNNNVTGPALTIKNMHSGDDGTIAIDMYTGSTLVSNFAYIGSAEASGLGVSPFFWINGNPGSIPTAIGNGSSPVLIGSIGDDSSGSKLQVTGGITQKTTNDTSNIFHIRRADPDTYFNAYQGVVFGNDASPDQWFFGQREKLASADEDFSIFSWVSGDLLTMGRLTGHVMVGTFTDDGTTARLQVNGNVNLPTGSTYKINDVDVVHPAVTIADPANGLGITGQEISVAQASTTTVGTVQLVDSYSASSSSLAATQKAVYDVYHASSAVGTSTALSGLTITATTTATGAIASTDTILSAFQQIYSDPVYAFYKVGGSQSVDNATGERVDYSVKVEDNYNAVLVGSSWQFVAPRSGLYLTTASIRYESSSYAAGNLARLWITSSGVSYDNLVDSVEVDAANTGKYMGLNGSKISRVSYGEVIYVYTTNNRTAGDTVIDDGFISIVRIGN